MANRLEPKIQEKLDQRLRFYEDLGLSPFYRDRAAAAKTPAAPTAGTAEPVMLESSRGETLLKIRQDLGECTRCKLHRTRKKIVFGDGNPRANLVFVGEGPGADEDAQETQIRSRISIAKNNFL